MKELRLGYCASKDVYHLGKFRETPNNNEIGSRAHSFGAKTRIDLCP